MERRHSRSGVVARSIDKAASRFRRIISATDPSPAAALAALFVILAGAAPAGAASPQDRAEAADRMVVEAQELVYDETKNTVAAKGDVQIYYKGRILQADRVVYDRNTEHVFAEGHAKLTERDGTIEYADRFDLTDDLRNGFIESLQAESTDKTYFSAARAERSDDVTVYEKGIYTACAACADDSSKPRLWRLRAKRIIHDGAEKMLYYEDMTFEFVGVPIAYVPFWSAPDPTVKRKSGILDPSYAYDSKLGGGLTVPLFLALAPDYDLTITPTYFTRQGPLLATEFRQRLENGMYLIEAEGARMNDPKLFPLQPLDRRWRGMAQTNGAFSLNDQWKFGWDATVLSDRYYLQDYRRLSFLSQNYFFRESSSTIYLTGQGPRSYFDLRGFYFQGLSPSDIQAQLPVVHPLADYNRTFDIDPAKTFGVGGQAELDANFTSTSAAIANYESIHPRIFDQFTGLYNICNIYSPAFDRSQSACLLRGVGGNYEHGTLSASWKRKLIDPAGSVWTPFAFARFSGSYLSYDTQNAFPAYNWATPTVPILNAAQALFVNGTNNTFRGQATPGAGVEWRYPLLASGVWPGVSLIVEPIAQIVARPNQSSIPSLVNMDAQSLVFDDSTLFEWSKFSGYDRFETGVRVNYGGQASLMLPNGGYVNAMVGQSRQLAGENAYATPDAANVGLSSGLDKAASDWVGRFAFSPFSHAAFIIKGRFDDATMVARRIDAIASFKVAPLTLDLQYANYASQGAIGFDQRRQGLSASARYDVTKNYFVGGRVSFDMSRYLYNPTVATLGATPLTGNIAGRAPVFSIATLGFNAGYSDECASLLIDYASGYNIEPITGQPARDQQIKVTLQLRTLGETKFGHQLGYIILHDGVTTTR